MRAETDFHSRFNTVRHNVPASTPSFTLACNVYSRIPSSASHQPATPPIIFTHANGFHKEIWEPVIGRMSARWTAGDMYAFDCRNHGDSAVLNKDVLEDTFNWYSYAEDILKIVDTFGLKNTIAVGHSFGASAFILAEAMRPGTFSTIIAIDPTMFPRSLFENPPLEDNHMGQLTLKRSDRWTDRNEARTKLLEKKFFKAWHPEALELYLEFGLKEVVNKDGSTEVTLKCPKYQEAICFAAVGGGVNDAFDRMNELRIPVHIIAGEHSDINVPELVELKVARCTYGSSVFIKGTGHLVSLEKPQETAEQMCSFLDRLLDAEQQDRPKARL
ncbi:hypothetical protein KVV02_006982 [Mortierella alpina]|uniref:AB hydrolase-1 domain-containing protein n=1 Tax=Mortierella alpina TaxID=64518 RepID=A0A9P8CZ96_MORAP|nr:hypothetical protein KVV02_006982 [Mortierella alpina]